MPVRRLRRREAVVALVLAAAPSGCGDDRPEHCPDPRDPGVSYVENSDRDPQVCQTIRFQCVPGTVPFSDAECGCGCIRQ